jgi:hypothetical protein
MNTPSSAGCALRGLLLWLGLGLGLVAGCGGADNRPPRWSFIAPTIIEPSCATASCHAAVAQRAGVALDPPDTAYQTLVGRSFVIPGHPEESELVALLRAQGSQRMPPDFPLPEVDIELIEQWITMGAGPD